MIVNGYVIDNKYTGDGNLMIKVRIPSIHGPMSQREYRGKPVRNYTQESDLPWYPSNLLPYIPGYGEVVQLSSTNDKNSDFVVIGMTGGSYYSNFDTSETKV